jgi:hypothetical protein
VLARDDIDSEYVLLPVAMPARPFKRTPARTPFVYCGRLAREGARAAAASVREAPHRVCLRRARGGGRLLRGALEELATSSA